MLPDPAAYARGDRPQLQAGVEVLLDLLAETPPARPRRPAPPDRSGMGITPRDR